MTKYSVDAELKSIQRQLRSLLGPTHFGKYSLLLESFLGGRLGKCEFEGALQSILKAASSSIIKSSTTQSPILSPVLVARPSICELHNKYIGLVLEKLSSVEGHILDEWERQREERPYQESACLPLKSITLTGADEQVFRAAISRPPFDVSEWEKEQERIFLQFRVELAAVEKTLARPLLAQISGKLPDGPALKAQLDAWLRSYGLDPSGSDDDEIISLIHQALLNHLNYRLTRAATLGGSIINLCSLLSPLS